MECNDGMENRMEQSTYDDAANLCNWHFSLQVELPSVSLGLLSHHRSLTGKYGIAHRHASVSVQAWYYCWLIINWFVIVVLQSQTHMKSKSLALQDYTVMECDARN